MKLLQSTESKIIKDKNGRNVAHLKIVEVARVLYSFVLNKPCGSLLGIIRKIYKTNIFTLKTFTNLL